MRSFGDRIVLDINILGGVPVIKGTRISVATILACLADDYTIDEVLDDYDNLTRGDVLAALKFAAAVTDTPFVGWATERGEAI